MHWILQPNFFNEAAYDTLIETLARFSIPYTVAKYAYGAFEHEPQLTSKNVMCMGTYSMRAAARDRGWFPGVFDLEPYDFPAQLAHWGDHMLNADAEIVPFGKAKFLSWAFVRPLQDSKVFDGKLYRQEEFMEWQARVNAGERRNGSSLTPDVLVQVCLPKTIHAEYRFWIVKGEIITASMYRRSKQVYYSSDVDSCYYDFVRERIKEWMPLETFVIDVCSVPSSNEGFHDIKIVEINTLNSAGYYAGDVQKLVMALHEGYSED